MSKNRQRTKQRQAQRRAQRLREQQQTGSTPGAPRPDGGAEEAAAGPGDGAAPEAAPAEPGAATRAGRAGEDAGFPAEQGGTVPTEVGVEEAADLAASAPPEDAGRSDTVVETPPPPQAADPDYDPEAAASRGSVAADADEPAAAHDRNRVVAFLIAVWAELQRVQWPNRQQVTTLTGVVIGFVIIMGAYLGALDAIISRLIQALL